MGALARPHWRERQQAKEKKTQTQEEFREPTATAFSKVASLVVAFRAEATMSSRKSAKSACVGTGCGPTAAAPDSAEAPGSPGARLWLVASLDAASAPTQS